MSPTSPRHGGSVTEASRPADPGDTATCVGITIPVPEPLAGTLETLRASFGDPMAALVPPHITLITTTPASDWGATIDHVRQVAREQQPFEVRLHGTGSFRPVSPVVFLRLVRGAGECADLHTRLQSGPLERDLAFDFFPHVTVAHDVSDAGMDEAERTLATFEASFRVQSMGLYEHVPSGLWKLREELNFGEDTDRSQAVAD
ncbi:2'-5' RNA ligase family protein [Arthrobacter echini]|uniref:2'-5' RNA ligase family protein n=1 Tax=Arthrobacter echini TaxID=1529066 RepID=A0A4S5E8D4_9MICC|nr:2'-5' RNA ligase family protein [Arthrobacter echini]THJ67925.1 2'-5' RNA ligase family protein [Arthrobacter echini]